MATSSVFISRRVSLNHLSLHCLSVASDMYCLSGLTFSLDHTVCRTVIIMDATVFAGHEDCIWKNY